MDKLEFSLPQDAKTQFKLIRLTGFRKTDFQKSYSIYSFQPQSRFLKKNYLRMLPHKFQFILQAGFWEDDIKGFVSLYSFVKLNPTSFPFLAYPIPRDHDLNKLYLPSLMMRSHKLTSSFREDDFKEKLFIFICKNQPLLHWAAIQPWGNMIWRNLNLRYVRILLQKVHLIWPIGFW